MSITGIEKLEFGVDDLNHSAKFMHDFGLACSAAFFFAPKSKKNCIMRIMKTHNAKIIACVGI